MAKGPKLSQGKKKNELPQATPRLRAPKTDTITIEKPEVAKAVKRGFGFVFGIVVSTALVLALLYLALASTLMAVVPGSGNLTWVARATFVGGEPDPGKFVYITSDPSSNNGMVNKALQGTIGVEGGATVEIVAGPYGDVRSDKKGNIRLDKEVTGYTGNIKTHTLNKEYLAICLEGDCTPGEALIVNQANLVGEAKGRVGTDGIAPFKSVKQTTTVNTGESGEK